MTAAFPHSYAVSLTLRQPPDSSGMLRSDEAPSLPVGPPPQFGGRDDWWSPEQLLLGAVTSCKMTTFMAIARNKGVEVQDLHCDTTAELDKTKDGIRFTHITVRMHVTTPRAQCAKVERIVEATRKHCIVSNALNVPVDLQAEVQGCEDAQETTAA
jgi:organic hydroperoxide reductase OsmC/OhrA